MRKSVRERKIIRRYLQSSIKNRSFVFCKAQRLVQLRLSDNVQRRTGHRGGCAGLRHNAPQSSKAILPPPANDSCRMAASAEARLYLNLSAVRLASE
jgi:hypothetical protein